MIFPPLQISGWECVLGARRGEDDLVGLVVLAILIHKGYIDINLVYEDSKSYQAHKVVLVFKMVWSRIRVSWNGMTMLYAWASKSSSVLYIEISGWRCITYWATLDGTVYDTVPILEEIWKFRVWGSWKSNFLYFPQSCLRQKKNMFHCVFFYIFEAQSKRRQLRGILTAQCTHCALGVLLQHAC